MREKFFFLDFVLGKRDGYFSVVMKFYHPIKNFFIVDPTMPHITKSLYNSYLLSVNQKAWLTVGDIYVPANIAGILVSDLNFNRLHNFTFSGCAHLRRVTFSCTKSFCARDEFLGFPFSAA